VTQNIGTNNVIVEDYLRTLRADSMQDWRAEYLSDDSPAEADIKQIVRGTGLTEGKVRGAVKRLEDVGAVVDVTSGWGHAKGRKFAHAAEVESTTAVRNEARRKMMENRHGNAQSFRDELIARADKASRKLAAYVAAVEATDDLLELDHLNVILLHDNVKWALDKD
jgi:hypothetical protein